MDGTPGLLITQSKRDARGMVSEDNASHDFAAVQTCSRRVANEIVASVETTWLEKFGFHSSRSDLRALARKPKPEVHHAFCLVCRYHRAVAGFGIRGKGKWFHQSVAHARSGSAR
jgi:hypothetical protein